MLSGNRLLTASDLWAAGKSAQEIADAVGTTRADVQVTARKRRDLFPSRTDAEKAAILSHQNMNTIRKRKTGGTNALR